MRYEVQWKKKVATQWNREKVNAGDLVDVSFRKEIIQRLGYEFKKIPKLPAYCILDAITPKAIKNQLIYFGAQSLGGPNRVIDITRSGKEEGKISRSNFSRFKSDLFGLAHDPKVIVPSPLVEEMEIKFERELSKYLEEMEQR